VFVTLSRSRRPGMPRLAEVDFTDTDTDASTRNISSFMTHST